MTCTRFPPDEHAIFEEKKLLVVYAWDLEHLPAIFKRVICTVLYNGLSIGGGEAQVAEGGFIGLVGIERHQMLPAFGILDRKQLHGVYCDCGACVGLVCIAFETP